MFGALDISPTNRLTFASAMTYRQNPSNMNEQREYNPTFALYGRNLLRAADAALDYSVHVTDLQSGESDILTEREFHTYIYPGEYFNLLNGVIVYLAYASSASTLIPNTVSPVKYAFVTDDRTGHVNTNEEFGVAYFPVDNLLISTLNARHTQTNLPNAYRTHERAKYWFESGGSIEGNVGYAWNDFSRAANVSAMYEHNWGGGMLTGKGAFCAYSHTDENANVDIDDVLNGYSPGLQFLFSLTRALSGRVRSVENSQLLRVYAHETDMSNLNFDYAMYLRLTMPPNVSLVGELRLVSALGERLRGNGGIYLHAGF